MEETKYCKRHDVYYSEKLCWKCVRSPQEASSDVKKDVEAWCAEVAAPASRLPSQVLAADTFTKQIAALVDKDAPNGLEILNECIALAAFLIEKNTAYGASALNPVRIMSNANANEQIRVRMDDKLSRLVRGEQAGEDAILDLVGYYILLKIAEKQGS